jgi:hypothetical protein
VPGPGKTSAALHWYSLVVPTVIPTLVGVTLFEGVQDPLLTTPHVAPPVVCERSVPQLRVAELPTTSVMYGYRRSADEYAAAEDEEVVQLTATSAATSNRMAIG